MMTKQTRERWSDIFSEFEISGLSAAEFCRSRSINVQLFHNMKYRFKKEQEMLSSPVPARKISFAKIRIVPQEVTL